MVALHGEGRRRVEPSGVQPLPMAIAVLALVETVSEDVRRSARLDLALHAYKLGYFVVDLLEVTSGTDAGGTGGRSACRADRRRRPRLFRSARSGTARGCRRSQPHDDPCRAGARALMFRTSPSVHWGAEPLRLRSTARFAGLQVGRR